MARLPADYYGSELDFESCEIITLQCIDARLLRAEPALYERKWFDYRQLHPVQATYLMVHFYNRAYGDFLGVAVDRKRRFTAAIKGRDFMLARDRRSFWRLRQKIDELGIRYDFFLRHAMNWLLANGWSKGCKQAPRPQHLLGDELIIDVANAWARECRASIQFCESPRFAADAWVGAPDQIAYERWLVDQISRRAHPKFGLHAALYVSGTLRIEAALAHFPLHTVSEAIDYCQYAALS
jgi:hypothetical protein